MMTTIFVENKGKTKMNVLVSKVGKYDGVVYRYGKVEKLKIK